MENNKKPRNSKTALVIVGIIAICIAVVCILVFFMQGKTTVVGDYSGTKTQARLICESTTTSYPLFNYDNSTGKSMKITATFEDDELNTISLIYKLNYNDAEEIKKSESVNHAALGVRSQDDGLGPDAYEAKYSKLKDGLQLSLYASKDDIDSRALEYFLLNDLISTPYNQEKVAKIYAKQGLKCEANN